MHLSYAAISFRHLERPILPMSGWSCVGGGWVGVCVYGSARLMRVRGLDVCGGRVSVVAMREWCVSGGVRGE